MKNLNFNKFREKKSVKTKTLFKLVLMFSFVALISCSNEPETIQNPVEESQNNLNARFSGSLQLIDGVLVFPDKRTLQSLGDSYRGGVDGQNKFNRIIRDLQSNGFKSLTPIIDTKDTIINSFVKRKRERLIELENNFGMSKGQLSSKEIQMKDDIIADPFFSTILNENREIIVGDEFFKYTELGLYFCRVENKVDLYNYLKNMTPAERITILTKNREVFSKDKRSSEDYIENVGSGITHFCKVIVEDKTHDDGYGGGGGGSSYNPPAPQAILNAQSLGTCVVEEQGFFEDVFGASEDCYDHYSDNRRSITSFWNQNYFIYASIGSSISLEKRKVLDFWLFSIVWWDNSYADKMVLGVNTISYKYNFNVPMFNQAQYNYSTTFFEYNGTKYNLNGQVIPTVPTGQGKFVFDTDSNQNVLDITVLGYNHQIDSDRANSYINDVVNALINISVMPQIEKQRLQGDKNNGNLKVNILYAVPFTNNVRFITSNVAWRENDAHRISHYFDFNFVFTYKNTYSGYADYLSGLNGATSYTEVKADIYGAALHNNEWRGRRLTYKQ